MSELRIFKSHRKKHKYHILDLEVTEHPKLSSTAKWIHTYVVSRPEDWKVHFKDLLNRTSDGERKLRTAIQELKKEGYLTIERLRDDRNRIIGTQWNMFETHDLNLHNVSSHVVETHTVDVHVAETSIHNNKQVSNNHSSNKQLNNKQSNNICSNLDLFTHTLFEDIFWKSAYRKVGKGKSIKAFLKLNNHDKTLNYIPSTESLNLVMSKWIKQNEEWKKHKTDKQYVPHPSTWLNEHRFNDDIETKKSLDDMFVNIPEGRSIVTICQNTEPFDFNKFFQIEGEEND